MKNRHMFLLATMLLLWWPMGFSCSYRGMIVSEVADVLEGGIEAAEREDNLHLLGQALPAQIQMMEALALEKPQDARLAVMASRMYAAYAFVTLETEYERVRRGRSDPDGERQAEVLQRLTGRYYRAGVDWAARALEIRYPGSRDLLGRVDRLDPFLEQTTEAEVPMLFWYGFNLAGYIQQNRGDIEAVARAHLVERFMNRVRRLQPTYYHGAAGLVLLAYHGAKATLPGDDRKELLELHRALSEMNDGRFLLNDLMFALGYHLPRQDRAAFQSVMERILDGEPSPPTLRMLNAVAVERARIYLDAADSLFEDDGESRGISP